MRNLKRILAMCLALMLVMAFPVSVAAADHDDPVVSEVPDYLIDESNVASMTIYKYDLTNSEKDGVWDSSYVSTDV